MAFGITTTLTKPYYTGSPTTSDVPSLFPIALNGRPYIVDLNQTRLTYQFKRETLPVLRSQSNVSNLPDESSMNPEDLWRRSQDSWHKGAGQRFLDKQDSDPARFRSSLGVNVWDKWQLTCLHDAFMGDSFVTVTDTSMVATSTRLFLTVNNGAYAVTAPDTSFVALAAAAGANYKSSTTDGHYVYLAKGADGVYLTNKGVATAAVSWVTGTVNLIRFVQGRLMAAAGAAIYNITTNPSTAGPTALPAALKTMANSDWTWVDFAEGPGQIYAAGYSGDRSMIYRSTIKADGTALDEPVVAGLLPDGEIIQCMQGYLGYVILGTQYGVRFCNVDGQGNLIVGPLLNTGKIKVTMLEPQDRFVWFSWPSDGTFAGLGRMDLSVFTAPQAPAFATDLTLDPAFRTDAVTTIPSVVTFKGVLAFSALKSGTLYMWTEKPLNPVLAAQLDSGVITYGLPDSKVAMWADVRMDPLPTGASVELQIATDGGAFVSMGVLSTVGTVSYTFPVGQKLARNFELRLKLVSNGTTTPNITRFTLRAYAAPNRAEQWSLPILLHETILANGGVPRTQTVVDELNRIRAMISDKQLVTYQEGNETHLVFVEDYTWVPRQPTADATFWQGLCSVTIKETST
jgi:hypothetical protein